MILDDPPLKSPPPNDEIDLDDSSEFNEEIDKIRPPSPICSSTDEYDEFPDPESEQPTTQSPNDSSYVFDQEYERPPLDWCDMDPAQRLNWLREHQLPTQKPSKLILTDSQDLSRRQIDRLKRIKRPKSFHTQSSKEQFDSQQIETDSQSPLPTLTITPTQILQPNLTSLEKRNYHDHQTDSNEAKKQRLENTPDNSTTNDNPPPQSPTPFIDDTTTSDLSQAENDPDEQPLTNKQKQLDQQHEINLDSQETKKQRTSHGPDTPTTSKLPTTHPFTPIDTIIPEGLSTPTSPQLETLTISTCPQLQPQPQTIESTPNEISLDSLNQEDVATETHGFKLHSMQTIESAEPTPQEPATSTSTSNSNLRTEPILLQLATPMSPLTTSPDRIQLPPIAKPDNWNQMSAGAQRRWKQAQKHKK